MPPASTNTSVRDMTQRLLEQFRSDVRSRAQRPPPEQKRKELQPLAPKQEQARQEQPPFSQREAPPHSAPTSTPTIGVSPVASSLMGVPSPLLPLASITTGTPAAFSQKPLAPTLPSLREELSLELNNKATVLSQETQRNQPIFRVKTSERELWMRWVATPTTAARETLQRAAKTGLLHASLLWPVDLATSPSASGMGCLTPVAKSDVQPLHQLPVGTPPLRTRVTAALHLTEALLSLHSSGWSLHGLSSREVLINPATGDLSLDGWWRILGIVAEEPPSDDLVAPEARSGQKPEGPYADLHALAVLVFLLVYQHHPFAGRKALALPADDASLSKLCASPVFLFDPARTENEAVPLTQDPSGRAGGRALALWNQTLADLRNLFQQALAGGLTNPASRPGASSWRLALGKLRDALFPCASCGVENVYDLAALQARGGAPGSCLNCGATLVLPARMKVGRHVLVLPPGGKIYRHHVEIGRSIGSDVVAEVSCHPQKPEILGIKNVSGQTWSIQWPDGKLLPLEQGKTIKLENGLKIQFGQQEGEVRR